jgi:hypothetical protein
MPHLAPLVLGLNFSPYTIWLLILNTLKTVNIPYLVPVYDVSGKK